MPRKERTKCGKCGSKFDGVGRSHSAPAFAKKLHFYQKHMELSFDTDSVFCQKCYSHVKNYFHRNLTLDHESHSDAIPEPENCNIEAMNEVSEASEEFLDGTQRSQNNISQSYSVGNEAVLDVSPANPASFDENINIVDSEMLDYDKENFGTEDDAMLNVETTYSEASSVPPRKKRVTSGSGIQNSKIHVPLILSVPSTQSRCFICAEPSRTRVSKAAADNVWSTNRIYIPIGSRACEQHVENGVFSRQAKEAIQKKKKAGADLTVTEIGNWMNRMGDSANKKIIDVDSSNMTDSDYNLLFGVSKTDFDNIFETIQDHMRSSSTRSSRNALAVLLAKLRLGISQRLLAYLFGIPSQRQVSTIISRVTSLLDKHFVPKHFGYNSADRQQQINDSKIDLVTSLFDVGPESACLFLDGTYIFIQKSKDHRFQRKTYSLHKFRNLLKAMMVVLPNGKILYADGMYFADYVNSDSYILEHMLEKEDGIKTFLQPGDHVVVDRGFQNITRKLTRCYKLKTHMPSLLKKKQSQFTTKEANETRKITMVRWIVESVNGRIKNVFKLFDQVVPAHYFVKGSEKKLSAFFRISCAILNAYYPPLFSDSEKHQQILDAVKIRANTNNTLLRDIKTKNLYREKANWTVACEDSVPNFPKLSKEDLFDVTLGSYQTKNALGYTKEHLHDNGQYKILVHSSSDSILRVKVQSRFHKNQSHDVWIEYNSADAANKIGRYYCTCKVGARTLGCCSHVAAPLWYLGYRRHLVESFQPFQYGLDILDAMVKHAEREESEFDSEGSDVDEDNIETDTEELPSDDEFYQKHFETIDMLHRLEESPLENSQETEQDDSELLEIIQTYSERLPESLDDIEVDQESEWAIKLEN